jgi:hypothetical protein
MEILSGLELGLDIDVPYATFTFQCRDAQDFEIKYNLVFGVQGQMTQITSDCVIRIREHSGTTNDPNTFTNKDTSFTVAASTPQFYLQNFAATVPAAPTVPATEFANGADIRFAWESNGTFFQIYQKNVTQPIYSGTETNFLMRGGVASDTTFFLVGMVSGNPSADQPFGNYQPIFLYDALTITISNPDLTPRSSSITGNSTVGGTLGVTGQTNLGNAIVGGTLTATGQTNLGNANVGGTLGVTGQTNLGNASVGGTLGVTGQANLKNTSVQGSLGVSALTTLSGGLTALAGAISMFTGMQAISPGSYSAKTDGFAIGWVGGVDNSKLCITSIWGSNSDGVTLGALGGNVGEFQPSKDWRKWQSNCPQSFTLPVRKGTTWGVSVSNFDQNEANAPTKFWWIPLGTATGATIEKISDVQEEFPISMVARVPLPKDKHIHHLVNIIEKVLGRRIDDHLKKEMIEVLIKMQIEDYETVTFGK